MNVTSADIQITFQNSGTNEASLFSISIGGGKPVTYTRAEQFVPTLEQLRALTGSFYSEELDSVYTFAVEDGRLIVVGSDGAKRPLTPTIRSSFIGPGGAQYEFIVDSTSHATSFVVNAGRIRNVGFVRKK